VFVNGVYNNALAQTLFITQAQAGVTITVTDSGAGVSDSSNAFTVVGDDDQSIYAWRGARPENLKQLQIDFPSLQVIKLEQNYRSTGRILKAANRLIANNPHLFEKRLWSKLGPGEPIRITKLISFHDSKRVSARELCDRVVSAAATKTRSPARSEDDAGR